MLLPLGTEKHKNLSTSFTRWDQLWQDLAENRFSGYLKLNFWGYEGVLVMDTGRIIQAYSTEQDVFLTGEQAVLRVMERGIEEEGSIEVSELSSEVALALGYALQSSVYKDENALSNYSLGQVFDMLEREGVTGYVDLQFSSKKGNGTVYYLEGTPVEAVLMSSTGKMVGGEQVFTRFLEIGEHIQPGVKIHRVYDPEAIVEDRVFIIPWLHDKFLAFWEEFLQYLKSVMDLNIKRNKFYSTMRIVANDLTDHYPFLDEKNETLRISDNGMTIERIIHSATFFQAMVIVLNRVFSAYPLKPFRKPEKQKILADLSEIMKKHEVEGFDIDLEKLLEQIFRGVI